MKIVREERKKRIINYMLCKTFYMSDDRNQGTVTTKTLTERLMHTSPSQFSFNSHATPYTLVQDVYEKYP